MTIRVGVCGLGFMGRTHLEAYAAARADGIDAVVAAVADRNEHKRRGELDAGGNIETGGADEALFDPDAVEAFADPFELVREAQVDLVSICTHTPSHVDLAVAAIERGLHVLVEKPVALASAEVERLVAARDRGAGGFVVPGMCIRFWPGWRELKELVDAPRLGDLRSLAIRRLSPAPGWGARHYGDASSTGGALFDLHVHDADLVHWLFGEPDRVDAVGTRDHVFATYGYDAGFARHAAIQVEGGWDLPAGFPFHMGYLAVFEGGTLAFDSGAEQPLTRTTAVDEAPVPIAIEDGTGYEHEVRALLRGIEAGALVPAQATALDDAVGVTRTLEREAAALSARLR